MENKITAVKVAFDHGTRQLIMQINCSRWTKGDHDRMYLNFDAGRNFSCTIMGKTFIDLKTGDISHQSEVYGGSKTKRASAEEAISTIMAKVAEIVKEELS